MMRNTVILFVAVMFFWLGISNMFGQPDDKPCNEHMTFCWYGPYQDGSDEVTAWGSIWKSDDATEKPLPQITEVRCVKRLHVCIYARNQKGGFAESLTNIDLYNVRSWNDAQIRAVMDETIDPECEENTLVINRVDRSVLMISSPGPQGNDKRCTSFMGPPKTVVYRLSNPELEKAFEQVGPKKQK